MSQLKIIIGNKRYSSWSLRGWLAVQHTGLSFEEVLLRLDTPSFYEEIEKVSPARKVPTLIDSDSVVWDSAAIIDYCARLAPSKYWWPDDDAAYAHARSIFNEMHSGFNELRTHMPMNLKDHWSNLTFSEALQKDITRVETLFTECRARFGGDGAFLFGDFSAVDMMFAPVATRLDTYGVVLNSTARAYVDAVLAYGPFKSWKEDALLESEIVAVDQLAKGVKHLG
mgnify:CR=1 FL=1